LIQDPPAQTLVLGIGNVLMGDEGVGVDVIRRLQEMGVPEGVTCLDGGTGSLLLLEPMQQAERVVLVDATVDGTPLGTVQRLEPSYSKDYPRTLTAHDIGLKDLLDVFYLLGQVPRVTLFTVSIELPQELRVGLSTELAAQVPLIARRVREELEPH